MYFFNNSDYGITENIFLENNFIGYVNFNKLRLQDGITPGAGTALGRSKKIALIKSYNEYLERYSLGLNALTSGNLIDYNIINRQSETYLGSYYAYGYNEVYGYNDTTGTATGKKTKCIIHKAVCELLEKNEMLAFWYGGKGYYIIKDEDISSYLQKFNFISDDIEIFATREISNYWTVYAIAFLNGQFLGSGVACTESFKKSVYKAIQEVRIIEWQNYKNSKSSFNNIDLNCHKKIFSFVKKKRDIYPAKIIFDTKEKDLVIQNWIKEIRIALIRSDKTGNKTIKCISKELMNCLPIKEYINLSRDKEVVKKYYNTEMIDCILV